MLDFIDHALCVVIGFGIPVLIGLYGLICVITFLALLPKNADNSFFFATCGVCVYGFFVWFGGLIGHGQGYEWMYNELVCSGTVAAIVMGVCIVIAKGIRLIGLPWFVVFLLYLGIAVFGL
ncbi:MAG: hypothetical protein ABFD92_03860 [Planctomycetaceae bacterium]|nr:hypothetical protein [Planctomycetaceae bacterium]